MSYPLTARFKVLAIAQQLSVEDASGRLLMYVKQKAFKLREAITVFTDESQTQPLYHVAADRVIDFGATYHITTPAGEYVGELQHQLSFWRSRYHIARHDDVVFTATEVNPWSKVANDFFESIPLLGVLSGYVFHPAFLISANGGAGVVRIRKQPAFFESRFRVERLEPRVSPEDERLLLIGAVTMILLQRSRG